MPTKTTSVCYCTGWLLKRITTIITVMMNTLQSSSYNLLLSISSEIVFYSLETNYTADTSQCRLTYAGIFVPVINTSSYNFVMKLKEFRKVWLEEDTQDVSAARETTLTVLTCSFPYTISSA